MDEPQSTSDGIDFGRTAADYGRFRRGFPTEFFERTLADDVVRAGDRLLDLGAGTGTVARGFAERGCRTVALDPHLSLLREGAALDRRGGQHTDRVVAIAESVPFADRAFDVVTAGQCWHWFDRAVAARECMRVLRPGGRLLICHFDWIPLADNVVDATERLILKHNPAWQMARRNGTYPEWYDDVAAAGFRDIASFTFDLAVPYTHEAWRGRVRASAGIGASLSPVEIDAFDHELAHVLETEFPVEPLGTLHRVFAVWGRRGD